MSRLRSAFRALRRRLILGELKRRGATLGENIKADGVFFSGDPRALVLRDHVCLTAGVLLQARPLAVLSIGRDTFINRNTTIAANCRITIGERVRIGPNCAIFDADHGLASESAPIRDHLGASAPIRIEDDAWLGVGAIVLKGVTIGRGATVGAGSVVTRDVPPFAVVAGNPARAYVRTPSLP